MAWFGNSRTLRSALNEYQIGGGGVSPAFREARKAAWDAGYRVGWEPFAADRELALGGEAGRPVVVL